MPGNDGRPEPFGAGWPWTKKLTFAAAVPLIMLAAWRIIHGVKRRVHGG